MEILKNLYKNSQFYLDTEMIDILDLDEKKEVYAGVYFDYSVGEIVIVPLPEESNSCIFCGATMEDSEHIENNVCYACRNSMSISKNSKSLKKIKVSENRIVRIPKTIKLIFIDKEYDNTKVMLKSNHEKREIRIEKIPNKENIKEIKLNYTIKDRQRFYIQKDILDLFGLVAENNREFKIILDKDYNIHLITDKKLILNEDDILRSKTTKLQTTKLLNLPLQMMDKFIKNNHIINDETIDVTLLLYPKENRMIIKAKK